MRASRRLMIGLALGALAAPLLAQSSGLGIGSKAEQFLKAVREQDGNAAIPLADANGTTVINYRGYDGATPLTVAVKAKAAPWVNFMLQHAADPNLPDGHGDTPLGLAAASGFMDAINVLLSVHAAVDGPNRSGETPLILAVVQHQPEAIKRLLEAGANPDKADHSAGLSARQYATRDTRNPGMLKLIQSVRASVRAKQGPSL